MGRGGSEGVFNGSSKGNVRKDALGSRGLVTLEELNRHCSILSCWIAIDRKVYDVTAWLSEHPGGHRVILNVAGQDATDVFNAMHSRKIKALLPEYFIGTLEPTNLPPIVKEYRAMVERLERSGKFETDVWFYYRQGLILLPLFLMVVAGVTFVDSTIVHLACAVLLGLIWTMCSFIGHDTGHLSIFKHSASNNLLGLLVGNLMTGIGITWWKRTHNVHHVICNSINFDSDIQHLPLLAISSKFFDSKYSNYHERFMPFDAAAHLLVSYQHWTFYPIMAVARINLYIQTFKLLCSKNGGSHKLLEFATLAIFWLWYGSLLMALPSYGERAAFFFLCLAVSGILHVQICVSHFSMPTYEGRPESDSFVCTQLSGTLDYTCPVWMDWFHGGLQFQIEHHLFPRLPRHNLRAVSPEVRNLCQKHSIPYKTVTFLESNVLLVKTLRDAAHEAQKLKSKPRIAGSLLWDGLNAQG